MTDETFDLSNGELFSNSIADPKALHIMICWEKSNCHGTQCRRNKRNTEQKIVDFSVCINL